MNCLFRCLLCILSFCLIVSSMGSCSADLLQVPSETNPQETTEEETTEEETTEEETTEEETTEEETTEEETTTNTSPFPDIFEGMGDETFPEGSAYKTVEVDTVTGIAVGMTEEEVDDIVTKIREFTMEPSKAIEEQICVVKPYVFYNVKGRKKVETEMGSKWITLLYATKIHIDQNSKKVDEIKQFRIVERPYRSDVLNEVKPGMTLDEVLAIIYAPYCTYQSHDNERLEDGGLKLVFYTRTHTGWISIIEIIFDPNELVASVHPKHKDPLITDTKLNGTPEHELLDVFFSDSFGASGGCHPGYVHIGNYYFFPYKLGMYVVEIDPTTSTIAESTFYAAVHARRLDPENLFPIIEMGMCVHEVTDIMGMPWNFYSDEPYTLSYHSRYGMSYCVDFDTDMTVIGMRIECCKGQTIFLRSDGYNSSQRLCTLH